MPIPISCACGRSCHVKDELAGKRVHCPDCQAILTVPQAELFEEVEDIPTVELADPPEESAARKRILARLPASSAAETQRRSRRRHRPSYLQGEDPDRPPRVAFEKGWFGSINAGIVGGLLMIIIAVVWFVLGLMGGIIFFYPPILFVVGVVALIKGAFSE
jgi:hypothetical protein